MKRILKWSIKVDDNETAIGAGPVVFAAVQQHIQPVDGSPYRDRIISIWTEEDHPDGGDARKVRVVGTGHPCEDDWMHVASVVDGPFVWHIMEVPNND